MSAAGYVGSGSLELRGPIPGESLDGFISAMVGDNDLGKVRRISVAGGITHGHRPQITTTGWKDLPELAEILETDVEELQLRSYPFVGNDESRRAFFGTTIHRTDLRTRERFFAPSALASSPHHRAMWQLRLPFDLDTGELLASRCTRDFCGKVQRWRHSAGIRYCDSCVEDLSEQIVPRLADDLLPDYRMAAGLTHTDPGIRASSLSLLPEEIRSMGADMAYELLLRLVPVMNAACTWEQGARLWKSDPFEIGRGMGEAWRALRGWPHTVLDKIGSDMAVATKRFNDGNRGQTLAFLRVRSGNHVAQPVAAAVLALQESIDQEGPEGDRVTRETIGCQEAANVTGIGTAFITTLRRQGALKTVVITRGSTLVPVYDRAEILQLDRDIRDRWDLNQGTLELGLPYYALEQLCALGLLPRLTHPFFAIRYAEPQISERAVREFAANICGMATTRLGNAEPILSAVRMVGERLKPWDAIVDAMLSGNLPFELRDEPGPLFGRIRVRPDDLRGPAAQPITRPGTITALTIQMPPGFPFVDLMTKRDAGEVLNLKPAQCTPLLRGYRNSYYRCVPITDVLAIAAAHVTCTELAHRSGKPFQTVRAKAAALGITALSTAGFGRHKAERLILPALLA